MRKNKNPEIKLIVCDLDGTMLEDKLSMHRNVVAVAHQLQARSILFVPATGRHFNICPWFTNRHIPCQYLITNNGAVLHRYNKARSQYEQIIELFFSSKLSNKFLTLINQLGLSATCITNQKRYVTGNDHFFDNSDHLAVNVAQHLDRLTHKLPSKAKVYQWSLWTPPAQINEVCRQVQQLTDCQVYVHSRHRLHNMIEFNPKASEKWYMVQRICADEGIKINEVMAIGNGENDMAMIKNAGIGACPDTSPERVAALADIVFPWNYSQGLVTLFSNYFLLPGLQSK